MSDNNNIPEEMSFDENALNNISSQGVSGYQPGMYQPGMYQPGGYQPGMYQEFGTAPQPEPQSAPSQAPQYAQYASQYVPQQAPKRVPQSAPKKAPQRDYQQAPSPERVQRPEPQRVPKPQRVPERKREDNSYDDKSRKKQTPKKNKKIDTKKNKKMKKTNNAIETEKENKSVNIILRIIGGLFFLLQMFFTIGVSYLTLKTQMIPTKYKLVAIGILLLFVIIDFFLLKGGKPAKKFGAGFVLTLLISAGLAYVFFFVYDGLAVFEKITGYKLETTEYVIYVREDDPAQNYQDVADYTFGTCFDMESIDSNKILDNVKKKTGKEPAVMDFPDMVSQVDGLLNGTTDATIISKAMIDTISELEGYEDIKDRIREVGSFSITTTVAVSNDEIKDANEVFAVFISGIDTEGDVNAKSRSDVNIIAVINPNTRQILLLSTPRDYFVTLYGLPGGGSSSMRDKLTHAGNFGIDCSAATLGELYGLDVDYYFRVNFTGFRDIIDALGGVDVYSDYNFSYGGYSFVQGENKGLSGDAALCFARERHAFADGDNQRGRNQMAVIEAVIHKMTSPAFLRNYKDTINGVQDSCRTSMPQELVEALVRAQLDDGGDWDVQKFSVTGSNSSSTTYSIRSQNVYVMEPNMESVEQARGYIEAMYNNEEIHVE